MGAASSPEVGFNAAVAAFDGARVAQLLGDPHPGIRPTTAELTMSAIGLGIMVWLLTCPM
ncbi:hypothetical protein [Nocardia sp. NBC_01388]|uniref:hypothetical protein n=1 Tax=Nocardia sp. NBC_01388 TaxID=2903596 RepID=UPI0032562A36